MDLWACSRCGAEGCDLRCSRCKKVFYCSRDCQKKHWKKHKASCRSTTTSSETPSSNSSTSASPSNATTTTSSLERLPSELRHTLNPGSTSPGKEVHLTGVPSRGQGGDSAAEQLKRRRLNPRKEDFPVEFRDFEFFAPKDGVDSNLLLMFHGLGDSPKNFLSLARKFDLPQFACLAVPAPEALPFGLGYSWYTSFNAEGNLLTPTDSEVRRINSLDDTRGLVQRLIETLTTKCGWKCEELFLMGYSQHLNSMETLTAKCGWKFEELFLMGYSQGAIVAVDAALHWPAHVKRKYSNSAPDDALQPGSRLGGVVAISGSLLEECTLQDTLPDDSKFDLRTPVLITHGTRDQHVSCSAAKEANLKIDDSKFDLRTPMLIMHGTRDQHVSSSAANEAADYLKSHVREPSAITWRTYSKSDKPLANANEARDFFEFLSKHMKMRTPSLENSADFVEVKTAS